MASFIIHMCVAKEINKVLKRNKNDLYLGSIAPDLITDLGIEKKKTHFFNSKYLSDYKLFSKIYNKYFTDSYVLGYYIHLYTDYIWFKEYIPNIITSKEMYKFIYNDYTYLNNKLIDKYNLELDIFNKQNVVTNSYILPFANLNLDKVIKASKQIINTDNYLESKILKINDIENFISNTAKRFIKELEKNG